jgi:hypothetical protein
VYVDQQVALYAGSILIALWGLAHVVPTPSVVRGFGEITINNRRIITMTWIAEGMGLVFVGAVVLLVTICGDRASTSAFVVYRASVVMLLAAAVLSVLTGARTSVIPMKICPFVKTFSAALIFVGSL